MFIKAKAHKTSRLHAIWVWANKDKGIYIVQVTGKRDWWDICHTRNGKTVFVHRDYHPKSEAVREAKSYATYWQGHPRSYSSLNTESPFQHESIC